MHLFEQYDFKQISYHYLKHCLSFHFCSASLNFVHLDNELLKNIQSESSDQFRRL